MTARAISMPSSGSAAPRSTSENGTGQLAPPKPIAALAAGLARPDKLGFDIRAHDADRGVEVRQVGAEPVERGLAGDDLAGQLGALADEGCGRDIHAVMVESRAAGGYLPEGEFAP